MKTKMRLGRTGLAVFAAIGVTVLGTVAYAVPGQVTADGILDDEVLLVLDVDGDGIPDVLQGRKGYAGFWLDNIDNGTFPVGPDGFRDAGLRNPDVPDDALCTNGLQCADADFGDLSVRSSLNTGKLTVIYLPDSDGFIDPGDAELTDDSFLYVGMDIFNGDARRIPPGGSGSPDVDYHDLDFVDTVPLGDICEDGVADFDGDGAPDFRGVPFDVDGDGNPQNVGRWDPLPECTPQVLLADDDPESYSLILRVCSDLQLVLRGIEARASGEFVGELSLTVARNQTQIVRETDFLGNGVAAEWIETFPDPTDPDFDETTEVAGLGPRDVEFIIRHVDTVVDGAFPDVDYALDRLRLAHGRLSTFSDADGDSASEDRVIAAWFVEFPQIETTKHVRCEGDPAWLTSVRAVPGSTLEFKIEVENTGNVPLGVTLTDALTSFGAAGFTIDQASLSATLFRPADGTGIPIDTGNAADYGLNPTFFAPVPAGFLGGVATGEPRYAGVLHPADVCGDIPVLGDRLELVFTADVDAPPDLCQVASTPVDVENAINATGDPDVPPVEDGDEVIDASGAVDTPRELAQGSDDNVVTVDVLCREVTFTKQVGFPGDPGSFTSGDVPLMVSPIPPSVQIEYRYTGANNGEVREEITISDDFLCEDIAATQAAYPGKLTMLDCPLCPAGDVTQVVNAGDPYGTHCIVEFTAEDALADFMSRDDILDPDHSGCLADSDFEHCYRNCAAALATVSEEEVCLDGPIYLDSFATVCAEENPCIDLEKATNGVDADDPNAGDAPLIAPGDPVTWTYVACNCGDVPLVNVTVTDDQGVAVSCPEDTLAVAECMACTAMGSAEDLENTTYTTVPGLCGGIPEKPLYENIGKATGESVFGTPVEDEDPSHYCNPCTPDIDIEKATEGVDADDPAAGDAPRIAPGDPVHWIYAVCNTGECPLINVTVTDDQGVAVTCPQDTLDVGECMTCAAQGLAEDLDNTTYTTVPGLCGGIPEEPLYENKGRATGETEFGEFVEDEDASHYCNPCTPDIDIEKATEGVDADDPAAGDAPVIVPGDPVRWTYEVCNTGECPLINVTVTDDQGVVVTCPQDTLDVGECMTCTAEGLAEDLSNTTYVTVPGLCGGTPEQPLYENKGRATGQTAAGDFVEDEDPSHYCNPGDCLLTVTKDACVLPPPAGEGCTPGYWKNHVGSWPATFHTDDDFDTVFGVDAFDPDITLMEALNQGGGGIIALGRHAVAALLNAESGGVDYALSVQEVIALVQAAVGPGGDIEGTKNHLEGFNEQGCPLGRPERVNDRATAVRKREATPSLRSGDECLPQLPCGVGADVEYAYTITNDGATDLTECVAVDDVVGLIIEPPGITIGPGETVVRFATVTLYEDTTNTVTVTCRFGAVECERMATATVVDDCQEECQDDDDCDDGNVCTDDVCNEGVCEHTNNTADCDDGNLCTENDVCQNGVCTGIPIECPPGQVCDPDDGICKVMGEGCTPGFWKNHVDSWPAQYQPTDDFDTVFGVDLFDLDVCLHRALKLGGGGIRALARHATAALLNAASPGVAYALSEQEVIQLVQAAAMPGGDIEGTKDKLEMFNEQGCPLGCDKRLLESSR